MRRCSILEDRHQEWDFEIPKEVYEGEEKQLKKRVLHFQKGIRRIFVFTIVGVIMGWFSYLYVGMDVLPLKVIVAIPYKLNEVLHNMIHGAHRMKIEWDIFFPNAVYVSRVAERVMPVLFGGAFYGSLSYFTGDRKVFTYKRFVKFFSVWACILAMGMGATFLANYIVVKENETFENVTGFMVHSDLRGDSYRIGNNTKNDWNQLMGNYLHKAFYVDGKKLEKLNVNVRDEKNEQLLCFWFGKHRGGYMECKVNIQGKYMVTDKGSVYRITDDFANMLEKFDQEDGYNRYFDRFEEKGEVISYEEMAD